MGALQPGGAEANGAATVPGTLPEGTTAATAPHANLAEIGAIFNDAADKILAGVNDGNRQEITDDINAVITDMEALMTANPQMFSGLTGVHADAVVRQLQLELTYINDPSISPDAGHASTDNILDIIDLIQGGPRLIWRRRAASATLPLRAENRRRYTRQGAQTVSGQFHRPVNCLTTGYRPCCAWHVLPR